MATLDASQSAGMDPDEFAKIVVSAMKSQASTEQVQGSVDPLRPEAPVSAEDAQRRALQSALLTVGDKSTAISWLASMDCVPAGYKVTEKDRQAVEVALQGELKRAQ